MTTATLNPFAAQVFETEEFSCPNSFRKEFEYKDRNHVAETRLTCADSDFSFAGPVQQLRLKYKNKADYSSGFAVFHTSVPRGEGKRGGYSKYANPENVEHVAILDLATFLEFFAQPVELADILVNKAKNLVSTWMEKNGGNDMIGKRRPISFTYLLAKYPWTSSKNRREESAYTLQLSSWGYTSNVQQVTYPKMGINDVKVLIKLKSTTNVSGGPAQAPDGGQRYDGSGYGVPFLHFVGMLRAPRFASYVVEVAETKRAALEAAEAEESESSEGSPRKKLRAEYDDEREEGEIVAD